MLRLAVAGLWLGGVILQGAVAPVGRLPELQLDVSAVTRLLVLAPHPDDEAIAAAGLIQRVLAAGGAVRVVMLTSGDGFPEGVEAADRIRHPTAADYRQYGRLRERETEDALAHLGSGRAHPVFLGFPDGGLCPLASKYLSFMSPYTRRVSPPATEQIVRGVIYRGSDLRRELEWNFVDFNPSIVVLPHSEDEHPDHCSTYIFTREAMKQLARDHGRRPPRLLHYLVHYTDWPPLNDLSESSPLAPPEDFPSAEGQWRTLTLTPAEAAAKAHALFLYHSQMIVIGRFLRAFARNNELFLEGTPASSPECWCDDEHVATELPTAKQRRRPGPKR